MTNKLPVVGKRYRHKETREEVKVYDLFKQHSTSPIVHCHSLTNEETFTIRPCDFFEAFEELPEEKEEQKHTSYTHQLGKNTPGEIFTPEVREAMEELKCVLSWEIDSLKDIRDSAQKLIRNLDNQFNSKNYVAVDYGKEGGDYTVETKYKKEGDKLVIEEINEIKPKKSIWKPVSELLYDSGLTPEEINIFEIITDSIASLDERLRKLETTNKEEYKNNE